MKFAVENRRPLIFNYNRFKILQGQWRRNSSPSSTVLNLHKIFGKSYDAIPFNYPPSSVLDVTAYFLAHTDTKLAEQLPSRIDARQA